MLNMKHLISLVLTLFFLSDIVYATQRPKPSGNSNRAVVRDSLEDSMLMAADPVVEDGQQEKPRENNERHDPMTAKLLKMVTDLKSEVSKLKKTVQKHKLLLAKPKNEKTIETADKPVVRRQEYSYIAKKEVPVLRTCKEILATDSSLPSAQYYIDPDGPSGVNNPILAHCDMETGSTEIEPEYRNYVIERCAAPAAGCYNKTIGYFYLQPASSRQLEILAALSTECHQSIKFSCYNAPFEFDGVAYSWWNDKFGNPQYFWAGSNASVHTCQCGLDNNCTDTKRKCNCDSGMDTYDSGTITNKNLLPISRLNFGQTKSADDSFKGKVEIGRFVCSGEDPVVGLPASCMDLWKNGHFLNGFYSVMGAKKQLESVYCDFTKLPKMEPGFQKFIGYAGVKSLPVYFYVQKKLNFNRMNTPMPFEIEKLNEGGSMNLTSGIFTAPRNGIYFFSVSGIVHIPSSTIGVLHLALLLNGNIIGNSAVDSPGVAFETFSLQSVLPLKANDKIWLEIPTGNVKAGAFLHDNNNHYTHFIGWLLHEDISQPLSVMGDVGLVKAT